MIGKTFNHLSGFLPSWDEQYRLNNVDSGLLKWVEKCSKVLGFVSPLHKLHFFVISSFFRLLISATWGISIFKEYWELFEAQLSKQFLSRGAGVDGKSLMVTVNRACSTHSILFSGPSDAKCLRVLSLRPPIKKEIETHFCELNF